MVDKIFTELSFTIVKERDRALATERRHLIAPGAELADLLLIGEAHKLLKQIEIAVALLGITYRAARIEDTAIGKMGYGMRHRSGEMMLIDKVTLDDIIGQAHYLDTLRARIYGRQNGFRIVADKDEYRIAERLFNQLEHLVGGLLPHSFGKPNYDNLTVSVGGEAELAHYLSAFFHIDSRLSVGIVELDQPFPDVHIWRPGQKLAPFSNPVVGNRRAASTLQNRKGIVGIYVIECLMLDTVGTSAAAVAIGAVGAMNVLGECAGKHHLADSGTPVQQQRVWEPIGIDHIDKAALDTGVGGYIGESHRVVFNYEYTNIRIGSVFQGTNHIKNVFKM